ncbi:hypothetical protein SAMN05216223_13030 [Actinacidiphila yanglinensis]|uniref:Uncharacterized protein n=1 Tax=Actinacidiphila yanglinensis TaxID=310779 RepID=A0A1H6ECA6_9ACTN|nr:hypothetical protein [Actinacidiphila yanglinensis]SEG94415.1 hypothetical protein SAMN05216223_13030 [Actinacidiphila yanglinensis]
MSADNGGHGPMVDNPWRQQLVTLRGDLLKEMHELRALLKGPCADVGQGETWVGPAADAWHAEAEGRRTDILAQLGRLVPLVDAEIRTCPEQVTLGEAKSLRIDLLQS